MNIKKYKKPQSEIFFLQFENYVCDASYSESVTVVDETDEDALGW